MRLTPQLHANVLSKDKGTAVSPSCGLNCLSHMRAFGFRRGDRTSFTSHVIVPSSSLRKQEDHARMRLCQPAAFPIASHAPSHPEPAVRNYLPHPSCSRASSQHKPTVTPNKSVRYPRIPSTPKRCQRPPYSCAYRTSWWRRLSTQDRACSSASRASRCSLRAYTSYRDQERVSAKRRPC